MESYLEGGILKYFSSGHFFIYFLVLLYNSLEKWDRRVLLGNEWFVGALVLIFVHAVHYDKSDKQSYVTIPSQPVVHSLSTCFLCCRGKNRWLLQITENIYTDWESNINICTLPQEGKKKSDKQKLMFKLIRRTWCRWVRFTRVWRTNSD